MKNGPLKKFQIACLIINYLNYVFSFNSAYIIVFFIVQRIFVITRPLTTSFKTKRSAWKTIKIISIVSLVSHIWIPILYSKNSNHFCDIDTSLLSNHHVIGLIYSLMNMLIPILVTSIGSLFLIIKTACIERKNKHTLKIITSNSNSKSMMPSTQFTKATESLSVEPTIKLNCNYSTFIIQNKRMQKKNSLSRRTTKLLIITGITFFILNTPYFLCWLYYYFKLTYQRNDAEYNANFIFVSVQITEVIYILNFSIKFYVKYIFGFKLNDWLNYPSNIYLFSYLFFKWNSYLWKNYFNQFIETVFGFKIQKKQSKRWQNRAESDSYKKLNPPHT